MKDILFMFFIIISMLGNNEMVKKTEDMNKENNMKISEKQIVDEYKKNTELKIDMNDVKQDIEKYIDQEFLIEGEIKAWDYYNYGFDEDIKKYYFCTELRPKNGKFTSRWYIYFHRESFKELYNELKKGKLEVVGKAIIPKEAYEEGQDNMAIAVEVKWIKNVDSRGVDNE